jgi:hypothetical protein
MDAPAPMDPLSPRWLVFGGLVVAVAALREAVTRLGGLAGVPKRPSAGGSVVAGVLLKAAVTRLGAGVTGPRLR